MPENIKNYQRIQSIDILRGAIMILMLIDHIRGFWSSYYFNPLDIDKTYPFLFFTRWITHFCAPTFIFLSGVAVFLSTKLKNMSRSETASFLIVRGLIILAIEVFLSQIYFNFEYRFYSPIVIHLQVMFSIGISMMLLAALQFIKPVILGIISLTVILLHNLMPTLDLSQFSFNNAVYGMLHQAVFYKVNDYFTLGIQYALIPWVFVMSLGYSLGNIFLTESGKRKTILLSTGVSAVFLFIVLRAFNAYGDPHAWSVQKDFLFTFLSFINVEKYPPSLLYLLITLGISFVVLRFLENRQFKTDNPFLIFGRTPMVFYIVHFILIVILAFSTSAILHGFRMPDLIKGIPFAFNVWVTYLVWALLLPVLYFICKKYYHYKRDKKRKWTAYF